MAGGGTTIGIVLGGGTLIGLAHVGARLLAAIGANKLPPMPIYGDWPYVPAEAEEVKVGAGGGRGGASSGADLRNSRNKQTQRTNPFRTGDAG